MLAWSLGELVVPELFWLVDVVGLIGSAFEYEDRDADVCEFVAVAGAG